ncbi:hypothetical protein [Natranaeroarchaeum sulfidigenes]|uniref:DUF8144 domain-containing protein n=1 Tax=Natranaeroarchaeum sulfidigenes TaxID=2784880 RepID=A0A897MQR1_9EURY|nr:hypothetical protein [Natranaeroarchaeum sulfidigenes]QSG01319.1 hypothetical protein AArcS_0079 [Natranaeroarchaeum sulfidigenes]
MASSQNTDTFGQWKFGLLIAFVILVGFGGGWILFESLDLPFGYVGGVAGGAVAFVLFSYLYYGR